MCAEVAGAVRPEKVRSTVIIVSSVLRTTVANPVAGEAFGGDSCVPLSDAVYVVAAEARGAKPVRAAPIVATSASSGTTPRRPAVDLRELIFTLLMA